MFEYHGWITVRETAADDDDEARLRQIVDELRLRIARMDSPYLLDLRSPCVPTVEDPFTG